MSYTIIYRKIVTKSPNGIVYPIIEAGSNNCYEGNRRARDWYITPSFMLSKEELTKSFKADVVRYFKEDDNDLSEETWLQADSKYWLSIKQEGNSGTINSLINMLTTPKHNFDDIKHLTCFIGSGDNARTLTLEELDKEIVKNGSLRTYVYFDDNLIESYLRNHKK